MDNDNYVPFECPVCLTLMRDAKDVFSYFSAGCCHECKEGYLIPNKVKNVEIIFGKNLSNKSIETNPPHLYAEGAINPVIHNIKNLATSSGHGSALFNTYLKNTCTKITITIKNIAIHANCLPILKKKVFIFSRILKTDRRILIVKFTTKFILII